MSGDATPGAASSSNSDKASGETAAEREEGSLVRVGNRWGPWLLVLALAIIVVVLVVIVVRCASACKDLEDDMVLLSASPFVLDAATLSGPASGALLPGAGGPTTVMQALMPQAVGAAAAPYAIVDEQGIPWYECAAPNGTSAQFAGTCPSGMAPVQQRVDPVQDAMGGFNPIPV